MKLLNLEITNFFSFGENISIDFTNYDNLVLVKGLSGEDDENSNGAGKSSLFESIYWCLTGKTVRGVRARDVVRIGEDFVRVKLRLQLDKKIEIVRYWSEKKKELVITIDDEIERFHDAKQGTERVFEILGLTPMVFSLVGFYGRKFTTFSNLTSQGRADLIDLLSDGQLYEKARKQTKQKQKRLTREYDQMKGRVERSKETLERLAAEIERVGVEAFKKKEKIKKSLEEVKKKIEERNATLDELLKSFDDEDFDQKIGGEESSIRELDFKEKEETDKVDQEFSEEIETLSSDIEDCEELRTQVRERIQEHTDDLEKHRKGKKEKEKQKNETDCVACGQPLPNPPDQKKLDYEIEIHIKNITQAEVGIEELTDDSNELKREIENKRSKQKELSLQISSKVKKVREKYREEKEKRQGRIEEIKQKQKDYAEKISDTREELMSFDSEKTKLENDPELVSLETLLNKNEDEFEKEEKACKEFEKELLELDDGVALAKYWVTGFRDIRFSAFNDSIAILQDLLTGFCQRQGLEFEKIEVEAFREKSDGDLKPEVSIYVVRGGHRMGLDALSEGETQKVNLACFFTFSLLLEKVAGEGLDFAILDEPLSGLDMIGREQVFHIINTLAEDKQLFVIDHDANFQDLFSSVIEVKKEKGISYVLI